jgi:eukaryotic-like serine/threonine-protein kinase
MFQPGEVIDDRYDVLGPLGQGGMAHVFRAHDRRLERTVALKVLRPHLTETDAERFRREIRALARFNHPGIVAIYDLGQGDHVYFAMELVEGGPITDLGPYDGDTEAVESLLAAAITVADALDYVHRLGMVHRDLTPRNILLTRGGHPKVMDFGLVRLTEIVARTHPHRVHARHAAVHGARAGHRRRPDRLGRRPLRLRGRPLPHAHRARAVRRRQRPGRALPARLRQPHAGRRPRAARAVALGELVDGLLAKRPEDRPASAAAVAARLRALRTAQQARAPESPRSGPGLRGTYPGGPATTRPLQLRWQRHLDEGPQWPAGLGAAAGWIAVGQRSDQLAIVHPSDGSVSARFALSDEVVTAPLFAHERLVVATRDGVVTALAWPQGRPVWTRDDVDAVGLARLGGDLS